jgi:hypothetical protein
MVNPETGLSHIQNENLEQIRLRYPEAQLVNFEQHVASIAAQQDAEPLFWKDVTEERYYEMLNVLPPAAMHAGAFLVGEPYDHHAGTGRPRFACFRRNHSGQYQELSCHITHKKFCELFGKTSYDYVE